MPQGAFAEPSPHGTALHPASTQQHPRWPSHFLQFLKSLIVKIQQCYLQTAGTHHTHIGGGGLRDTAASASSRRLVGRSRSISALWHPTFILAVCVARRREAVSVKAGNCFFNTAPDSHIVTQDRQHDMTPAGISDTTTTQSKCSINE